MNMNQQKSVSARKLYDLLAQFKSIIKYILVRKLCITFYQWLCFLMRPQQPIKLIKRIQNPFKQMKTEYLKNFLNLKQNTKQAYNSYLTRIQQSFEDIKANPTPNTFIKFESQLHAAKDHKQLKPKDKQPIYRHFIERNIHNFLLLRPNNSVELRLLKLTKTHLDDYQLDWQHVWEQLLTQQPQIPSLRLYNDLSEFLKTIRHLYSPNNALAVVNYFIEKHSLNTDNLCTFISSFTNINSKTNKDTLVAYLRRLMELYHLNHIKASDLLVMYINAARFKQNDIPEQIHAELSKIVLYSLATPNTEKKDSIESKFSTQTANILYKIIGKTNTHSITLLKHTFQLIKNFLRPFEDSKKPLKFLCLLVMGLAKRIQAEQNSRQRLTKLKAKQQKRQKNQQKKQALLQSQAQPESATNQQQSVAIKSGVEQNKAEKKMQEGKVETPSQLPKKAQQKQQQEQSDSQQQQQNDSDEQEQEAKVQKLTSMQLQIEDNPLEKNSNNLQAKIQKIQALLSNVITQDIKDVFKEFITSHLEDIFYVNSKKIVNRLLKQAFKVFPQLIPRSLQILQKAGNIPQINEEGLISNIKHIAKYLFAKEIIASGDFLDHILKILNRVQQNRRITDVWDIIAIFVQKIPLLDEKDLQKVPQSQKQAFQKKYSHSHDQFYETYSELIFQSLKRLFSESEHYDTSTMTTVDRHVLDLLANSHPFYKKRVIREMEEQVLENTNKFLLTIFHSGVKPSKSFEEALRQMIDNRNIESEQNLNLDINVNIILSIEMDIETVKTLFRKYSKKNNYKFLKQCTVNLTNYNLNLPPFPTTLSYLDKKPVFTLTQQPTQQFVQDKMVHVYKYTHELIEQLQQELKQFEEQALRKVDYKEMVAQVYSSKESTFKNMKVEKRKTINELLEILRVIAESLFHQFEEYNPVTNTIDYKPAPYVRESLLTNPAFLSILDSLTYNQIFLHDHNIMQNLSELLENQVFFMYRHQIRLQKDILKKYHKKNNREELPGQSNLAHTNNLFIAKARIAHFSILFNRYKDTVSIDTILPQLRILLIAPGNEKSRVINKIMVKKSKDLINEADLLVTLLNQSLNSRFYYEKVITLLGDFLTSGYAFSPEQIITIINAHLPLIQSENIKIRQNSLKSFEKFLKTMHKDALIGAVQFKLRQYTKKQKFELIWIIAILIILKQGKRDTPTEEYLTHLQAYLRQLQPLITSPTRIVRRLSLFSYSFCLRKAKQAIKCYQTVACPEQKYSRPKTIKQLFQTGYLRDEHKNLPNLAGKQVLKKLAPYTSYRLKTRLPLQIYQQIQRESFRFMLDNPQAGLKVVKQFHTDMAASVEQVLSMVHVKKHDLGEIAVRSLEGCYVSIKLSELHFSRFELHFGERFFRYLFDRDASNYGFAFFLATREEVEGMLSNLQAYDNQTLFFIYTANLLSAYQKHREGLSEELKAAVEKFALKVVSAILYKGSGTVFKKLSMLVGKTKHKENLIFLINYLETMVKSKEKVSRASQLLLALSEDNYSKFTDTAEFVLSERVEINHTYINTIINSVIALPQKYTLTLQQAQTYAIIDLKEQLTHKRLQKMQCIAAYMLSTEPFNALLRTTLANYINAINQPTQDEQGLREKNELIKATYSIATNAITAYCQFYETEEAVSCMIGLLELLFRLFEYKMDLPVDFKLLEEAVRNLVSNKYDNIANFQAVLGVIVVHLHKLPLKKQADILKIITNRPGNFLFVGLPYYTRFLEQLLVYEEHSMIYKEVLLCLSTLLAYVPLPLTELQRITAATNKGQTLLLLQGYLLSTQDFGSKFVERVLGESGKERRNMFCKEMLQLRGKREYLDDEEKYLQWKEIKQYSNPYHYHA